MAKGILNNTSTMKVGQSITTYDKDDEKFGSTSRDNLLDIKIENEIARAKKREDELAFENPANIGADIIEEKVLGKHTKKHMLVLQLQNEDGSQVLSEDRVYLDQKLDTVSKVQVERRKDAQEIEHPYLVFYNTYYDENDVLQTREEYSCKLDDALTSKIDLLGNEEVSGEPYHFTYYYDVKTDTEKITVTVYTITLDNNKTLNTYSAAIEGANSEKAGLETAAEYNFIHSTLPAAIAGKSTVSVSASGSATEEVSYITVDGVEKKLAGSGSSDFDILSNRPKYNGAVMTHETDIPEVKTAVWDNKMDKTGVISTDDILFVAQTAADVGPASMAVISSSGAIIGHFASDLDTPIAWAEFNEDSATICAGSDSDPNMLIVSPKDARLLVAGSTDNSLVIKSSLDSALAEKSKVTVAATGSATDEVQYITIDGVEKKIAGGGASDFDTLTNKPKYNGVTMTHETNIPEVKTATWDNKMDKIGIETSDTLSHEFQINYNYNGDYSRMTGFLVSNYDEEDAHINSMVVNVEEGVEKASFTTIKKGEIGLSVLENETGAAIEVTPNQISVNETGTSDKVFEVRLGGFDSTKQVYSNFYKETDEGSNPSKLEFGVFEGQTGNELKITKDDATLTTMGSHDNSIVVKSYADNIKANLANKIKYDIPDRTGEVINPTGVMESLYLNADVDIAVATAALESLTYTQYPEEESGYYRAFDSQTTERIEIMRIIDDGSSMYQIIVGSSGEYFGMYMFLPESVAGYAPGFYDILAGEEPTKVSGVIEILSEKAIQGKEGYGAENEKLIKILSFNVTFEEEGYEGLTLYKDSTPIAGQTSDKVKLKTINGSSIIGSGDIHIAGNTYYADTGININDYNEISVDTDVIAAKTYVDSKASELSAAISEKSKVEVSGSGTATDIVKYITVDGTEKKLAGEPDYYLQNASINDKTLTITKKDNSTVNYNPTTQVTFSDEAKGGVYLKNITAGGVSWDILPNPPADNGNYKLRCTVTNGVASYSWELDQ